MKSLEINLWSLFANTNDTDPVVTMPDTLAAEVCAVVAHLAVVLAIDALVGGSVG